MFARARLRLPDDSEVVASPGSLLGRAWTAEVRIDDGRISEAHAFFSLRGDALLLLALRGRLRAGGQDASRVELRAGLSIELAPGLSMEVLELHLPETLLALRLQDGAEQLLTGVTSVITQGRPHLLAGYHPEAAAVVWSDGLGWKVQRKGHPARPLVHGEELAIDGHRCEVLAVPSRASGTPETHPRATEGGRLRLVSRYDSVQLWTEGQPAPLLLRGQQARMIAELLAFGGPVRWEMLAEHLWPGGEDRSVLRHRLDVTLTRLRRQLEAAGIRRDLVLSLRTGQIELVLYPGDQAEDLA